MRLLRLLYRLYIVLKPQFGWNVAAAAYRLAGFAAEYVRFRSLPANPGFTVSPYDWYPCLTDRTASTPLDPVYFFQDTWAARKIFEARPAHHYDVGSMAKTVAIISQFVPTTMVDIRPVTLKLDGLTFVAGSILALPFPDGTAESISSLCVVEHIGLGRYGDPFDPFGSEKAARELVRVTRTGGHIYFSVPVDEVSRVYFNAHRSFTVPQVCDLFAGCRLTELKYICDTEVLDTYRPSTGYVVGLFQFEKL